MKYKIGIDPGVKTGVALATLGELDWARTFTAVIAEWAVLNYIELVGRDQIMVIIEDARRRKTVPQGAERLQGAGSVKRDSQRWEEFCLYHRIKYRLAAPSGKLNTIAKNVDLWERVTGMPAKNGEKIIISEHARCAAMLVCDKKKQQ
jgi:hypothetical protein